MRNKKNIFIFSSSVIFLFFICCGSDGKQIVSEKKKEVSIEKYTVQKKVECTNGAVVSAHPLASKVGVEILKQGGNAFDAAIAVQLALAVVYPSAGNIGGGGFMVAKFSDGRALTIDYREKAPSGANASMFLNNDGNVIPKLSEDGHLSCGVPGTVAGIFSEAKFARLPFIKLIQPAIDLAENGFVITEKQAESLNSCAEDFLKLNASPAVFTKSVPWKSGDTLIQKDLAQTLIRIRDKGQKGFYEGETAKLIIAEMQKGNGIISENDLKSYSAVERPALEFDYKDAHILSMPLPSSGGIILQQCLKMIETRNIADLKFQTAESVQLMTEVERRAYADRSEYLGDPDFVKVPLKKLLSDEYLAERMKNYKEGKAGNSKATRAGKIKESEETTHLSVVDKEGNAVSVTTTLNGSYGSRTVVRGAGFLLNNEMDDFSIKQGVANMYGVTGNSKNAIAPNKRMLSSMTPTIVLKNNKVFLITGTPGGSTIPTSVFQTLVNILEFKMSPEDAVNNPKFHHQYLPDEIFVEKEFDANAKQQLKKMGYKVSERIPIGRVELLQIENGKIIAVGDSRGDDDAEGF